MGPQKKKFAQTPEGLARETNFSLDRVAVTEQIFYFSQASFEQTPRPEGLMELLVILILNYASILGTAKQELNLLILEPTPNPPLPAFYQPSYAEGPALFLVAELATEMANRNSSVLPGYHLNLLHEDSGCSIPFRAVEAFAKPLSRSVAGVVSPIVGVIGPGCSLSSLSVATLSGRSEVALINIPIAGTHRLQDRIRYPYSFSILDSSNLLARGLVSLAQSFNWRKVALFYETTREYFLSIAQRISGSEDINITSNFFEPVGISRTALSPIFSVKNRFRIVFLLASWNVLGRILCIAYHENYRYPAYQYVVHSGLDSSIEAVKFQLGSTVYNCSRDAIIQTLNGSLFMRQQLQRPDTETVTSSGISLEMFNELYQNRTSSQQVRDVEPSIIGPLFYDAVWSLVLALNATATDLGSYGYGQPNITDLIVTEMTASAFEGLSGKVKFNKTTGHVDQNAQFFVLTVNDTIPYSYYNEETHNITLYDPVLINGSVVIKDTFDEVVLTAPKLLAYFILLLLLFGFLLTLTLNVATCAYRKVGSVKASSTKLSQVAFIGCYFQALSLLFAVLIYGFTDMINRDAVCMLQQLLDITFSVGLTVLLGTICVRIWRLHRIFNRYKNPGRFLSDQYLILGTIILVVINLALTVPAAFSPNMYQPVLEEEERQNSIIMTIVTCRRSSGTRFFLWVFSSLVVSMILLSIIFIFAILTRKIQNKNFKTKSTMYLSYTLAAIVPFTIGIYLILTFLEGYVNMVLRFSTLCSLLLCLILIPCAMLFFPPLLPILKKKIISSTM